MVSAQKNAVSSPIAASRAGIEFQRREPKTNFIMGYAKAKVVYIIIDGLGDLPTNGKTPLQAAHTPNMDLLAKEGQSGQLHALGRGIIPGSDTAHLALFGYDPQEYYKGRGTFEALGAGMAMQAGDIAFRANFGTIDASRNIIDRRAGRPKGSKVLEPDLQAIVLSDPSYTFRYVVTVEHRGAFMLRGQNLSRNVSDTDPHENGAPLPECTPLDGTEEAARTASLVNEFSDKAIAVLSKHPFNIARQEANINPANAILVRSPGIYEQVEPISSKYGLDAVMIAGGAVYKGVARYVGMTVPDIEGATGSVNTNLKAKADAALDALGEHDVAFIHVKATDNMGHDGNFDGKRDLIARIDKELVGYLLEKTQGEAYIIVTGDHSTPVGKKDHSFEPNPVVLFGPDMRRDRVRAFSEEAAMNGGLGHITGPELLRMVVGLTGKGKIFGS